MAMMTPQDISDLRQAMAMSAEEFASLFDVTPFTVWKWESGERHPVYRRMAKLELLRQKFVEQRSQRQEE